MELIDVTLREGIYCDFGLNYDTALDYLRNFVRFVSPEDVGYVEYVYLNTYEHALLAYDRCYIKNASTILLENGFKMVGMVHPGRVDLQEWDDELIKKFSLVRIVCNGSEIPDIIEDYIKYLHRLNVKVSVNIAYVMSKDDALIAEMYKKSLSFGADYVYFADSSGSANVYDISHLCNILKELKKDNKIGFHLHDHLGMASANAIELFKQGIDITDVSITGAGKGAGNLCLESFVPILRQFNNKEIEIGLLNNYLNFISYFNKRIGRAVDNHEFKLIQLVTGLFKLRLKQTDNYEEEAKGDVNKYLELVFSNL